ncbi:MAG: hypothetical protein GXP04_08420 [Alphaproteobacteria bacterium]|nr:hypothetical protein [Alphaproteobacteria bacterium]
MKRFIVFAGISYYARGGMEDFQGDFDTLEEAIENTPTKYDDRWDVDNEPIWESIHWWHVLDTETGRVEHVAEGAHGSKHSEPWKPEPWAVK